MLMEILKGKPIYLYEISCLTQKILYSQQSLFTRLYEDYIKADPLELHKDGMKKSLSFI